MINIPRRRLPDVERRESPNVRMPKWMIQELDSIAEEDKSSRTIVLEEAVTEYIKKRKIAGKK